MENKLKDVEGFTERFWDKVDLKDDKECWEWKRATQSKKYGSVGIGNGKTALAHRVAFMLSNGEIPPGLCVLHKCDNRKCVNPTHLFLGTIQDNNRDMHNKGRHAKGEKNGRSKLTTDDVNRIRCLHNEKGYSCSRLSKLYDVSSSNISGITKEKYWKLPHAE